MIIDFPSHYIDTQEELYKLKERLEKLTEFALDLEADVNLHRYGRKLCLAQIWDGEECWLLDLKVLDISCLKEILEDTELLKVMYAASFDVSLLADLLKIELQGLFDIQICTSILGNGKRSLKYFMKETFDLNLEKDLQTSDWYKRPLTEEQLIYAAYDVRYLLEAKAIILPQLEQQELLEAAYDGFHKVEYSRFQEIKDPYLRVRNSAKLTPYEKIRLKEFYEEREKIAEMWDLPTYKILRSYQLLKLCQHPPASEEDLEKMEPFQDKLKDFKADFLQAAQKAEKKILHENSKITDDIIEFRHLLHKHPELPGKEAGTEKRIFRIIRNLSPSKMLRNLGRNSSLYSFDSKNEGPRIIFRAEADAGFGYEKAEHDWFSRTKKTAHLFGHDGHMAILISLAARIFESQLKKGEVMLLFQASSINGKGAKKVINDKRFNDLNPDYIFSLHNLPGYPEGSLILPEKSFTPAVTGVIITVSEIKELITHSDYRKEMVISFNKVLHLIMEYFPDAVINFLQLGKPTSVIHPLKAEIRAELVAENEEILNTRKEALREELEKSCIEKKLRFDMQQTVSMPESKANPDAIELLKDSQKDREIIVARDKYCVPGDDFGIYNTTAKALQFGMGIAEDHQPLNSSSYDFPDKMIQSGVDVLMNILRHLDML